MTPKTKTCSTCKVEKPLDQFNKKKSSKDGISGICKSCCKISNRKSRDRYIKIREGMPVPNKKTCTKCLAELDISQFGKETNSPDGFSYVCKSCASSSSKEWRKKNPDKVRLQKKRAGDKIRGKSRTDIGLKYRDTEEKVCGSCGKNKSIVLFSSDRRSPDGHSWQCKECSSSAHNTWRKENIEKDRESHRTYAIANRDKLRESAKARVEKKRANGIPISRQRDPNKKYECSKCGVEKFGSEFYPGHGRCNACRHEICNERYAKNPEAAKNNARKWRKNNPDKHAAHNNKRRARINHSIENYTGEEFIALCNLYNWTCLKCGAKCNKMSPDHVIPLARGGTNGIDNIQPLCLSCNLKKHTSIIDYRTKHDSTKC